MPFFHVPQPESGINHLISAITLPPPYFRRRFPADCRFLTISALFWAQKWSKTYSLRAGGRYDTPATLISVQQNGYEVTRGIVPEPPSC